MINIRHKYPLISIPENIANACNSLIPITLSTQEPELEKKEAIKPNYQAAISLAVVSVLILFYLIPFPHFFFHLGHQVSFIYFLFLF